MGQRLHDHRVASGLSLLDLMVEVRNRLPRAMWVTHQTLRRYENGQVLEEKADPFLITVLAAIYEVPVGDLSPVVAGEVQSMRDLLIAAMGGYPPTPAHAHARAA